MPAHAVSDKLLTWVRTDVHGGAWPIGDWLLRGESGLSSATAFSYVLLLGPNGVGKSQLVREIALKVAREGLGVEARAGRRDAPGVFGRSRHALARWLRRVLPHLGRLPDDPWHVGEINRASPDGDGSLELWRPSAPTMLILDDPDDMIASRVVAILRKNCKAFWYSVKLVIIDQFTPPGLNLQFRGGDWYEKYDKKEVRIPIFSLPDMHWNGEQARAALSGGAWVYNTDARDTRGAEAFIFDKATDITTAYGRAETLEPLCQALDGSPLMLAEAAVWLLARKPGHTIPALLALSETDLRAFEGQVFEGDVADAYKEQIAHRLLQYRVDEVITNHHDWAKAQGLDVPTVMRALSCASLTAGMKLEVFEKIVNKKVDGSQLKLWIVGDSLQARWLPPVGSWPVVEAFIDRVVENWQLDEEALIREALEYNPVGLIKQLFRGGRLAGRMLETVERWQHEGTDAVRALSLFEIAATRAIRVDHQALPQALDMLQRLPLTDLPQAQDCLERIGVCQDDKVPDVLNAATLLTALGARRFTDTDWDWSAWEEFEALWSRWLDRIGNDYLMPAALSEASGDLYRAFYSAVSRLDDDARAFTLLSARLSRRMRNPLWGYSGTAVVEGTSWPAIFHILNEMTNLSVDKVAVKADPDAVRSRIADLAAQAKALIPTSADQRQRAYVDVLALTNHFDLEFSAEGGIVTLKTLAEEIGALADFPGDALFVERHLYALHVLAQVRFMAKTDAALIWSLAERAEALALLVIADTVCIVCLIWCWGLALGQAQLDDDAAFDATFARLQGHAEAVGEKGFEILAALTKMLELRVEGLLTLAVSETTEARVQALLARIDRFADAVPDCADVQRYRISAWQDRSRQLRDDAQGGRAIAAIVSAMDAVARPFPDHLLQVERLMIWQDQAYFESRHGVSPGAAERIAHHLVRAGEPFLAHETWSRKVMRETVVTCWAAAVFGWRRDPHQWVSCERALRQLEAALADHATSALEESARIEAWNYVMVVHHERDDSDAIARLEPEALARVEAALAAYPDDAGIADDSVVLLWYIGWHRHRRKAPPAEVADIVDRMRALAIRFPQGDNISKNLQSLKRHLSESGSLPMVEPPISEKKEVEKTSTVLQDGYNKERNVKNTSIILPGDHDREKDGGNISIILPGDPIEEKDTKNPLIILSNHPGNRR